MAFRVPQGYSEFPECRRQGTEERQCEDAPHTNVTTLAYNAQDQLTKLTGPGCPDGVSFGIIRRC